MRTEAGKHAPMIMYRLLLCTARVSTQFPPLISAPSRRSYRSPSLSLFPKAWWGLHKINCLTGGGDVSRGNLEDLVSEESRHTQPAPYPRVANARSDRDGRGLFKIVPHRHTSEDLNYQQKKKNTKKNAERKMMNSALTFSTCSVCLVGFSHPKWIMDRVLWVYVVSSFYRSQQEALLSEKTQRWICHLVPFMHWKQTGQSLKRFIYSLLSQSNYNSSHQALSFHTLTGCQIPIWRAMQYWRSVS